MQVPTDDVSQRVAVTHATEAAEASLSRPPSWAKSVPRVRPDRPRRWMVAAGALEAAHSVTAQP